jgi:uncharacterized repeat protein (TIGR01451 family)
MTTPRPRRRARTATLLLACLILATFVVMPGIAVGDSTFDSNNGRLDSTQADRDTDWNDLVTGLWSNPAQDPLPRSQTGIALDYQVRLDGIKGDGTDIIHQGGRNEAKHDVECPGLRRADEQNKSDFSRFGIAYETLPNEDVVVYLKWVRIPQNSTSASGHASFELNQGDEPCAAKSTGAAGDAETTNVKRTAGDVLFIYDFPGGSGQIPSITAHRWIDKDGNGANGQTGQTATSCEVAKSLPCWGKGSGNLVAEGNADARVNDASIGPVFDKLTNTDLGTVSFGEAGINFTQAGILSEDQCIAFGQARVSSRSSGNSFEADLKDWVEPLAVNINNCGTLTVKKVVEPAPVEPDDPSFDFTVSGKPPFALKHNETKPFSDVEPGIYTITESDPGPEYGVESIVCAYANGNGAGPEQSVSEDGLSVDVTVGRRENITCTFTNEFLRTQLDIQKTAVDDTVTVGDLAAFDIVVKNIGTVPARNVVVTDTLPAGFEWSEDSEDCSITDGTLTCEVGDLAPYDDQADPPGPEFKVRISATVPVAFGSGADAVDLCGDGAGPDPIDNTAEADAENADKVEDSDTITIVCSEIEVLKVAVADVVTIGDTAQFSVRVTNVSEAVVAKSVVLTDTLPAGYEWTVDNNTDCEIVDGVLTCEVGDLQPGAHFEVMVSAPISADACGATLDNTAVADADNAPPDQDTASIEVKCASVLVLKEYGAAVPDTDDKAVFRLSPGDSYDPNNNEPIPLENDNPDLYCIDDLVLDGEYTIRETEVPAGYVPPADQTVTASNTDSCADRIAEFQTGDEDATFTNAPEGVDLTVKKLKQSFEDGGFVNSTTPLPGFTFTLYEGTGEDKTLKAVSELTDANGEVSFTDGILEVNESYTVCETGTPNPDYWTSPDCQEFDAELDTNVSLTFYNAPKADVSIEFEDVTGFTSVDIVCTGFDFNGDPVSFDVVGAGDRSLSLNKLDLGDYDCTIKIRNGADGSEGGDNG